MAVATMAILTASCKKNTDNKTSAPPDKVIAKWNYVSERIVHYNNGTTTDWTVTGKPGDYIEFTTDGRLEGYVNTQYRHYTYSRPAADKISIVLYYTANCTVVTLSDNDLVYTEHRSASPIEYQDITTTLHR
ncbi:MAG: hypothetical protein WKF88_00520 [Ferruginibacter sp.]